jgi:hypothetical protein
LDEEAEREEREELIREAGRQQAERDRSKQDKDDDTHADHCEDSETTKCEDAKAQDRRADQQPFSEGDSDEDRQDWLNERMSGTRQYSNDNGRRGDGSSGTSEDPKELQLVKKKLRGRTFLS